MKTAILLATIALLPVALMPTTGAHNGDHAFEVTDFSFVYRAVPTEDGVAYSTVYTFTVVNELDLNATVVRARFSPGFGSLMSTDVRLADVPSGESVTFVVEAQVIATPRSCLNVVTSFGPAHQVCATSTDAELA